MKKKKLKYPPEFKEKVCEFAKESSIRNAARFYSVNKETVCRWLKDHKEKKHEVYSSIINSSLVQDSANDTGIIYIFFNIVTQTIKNNETYILYQFNITNDARTLNSIGFTASRSNTNLCIFLDFVLSTLKDLKKVSIKTIRTNIPTLKQSGKFDIFNTTIRNKFGAELEIIDSKAVRSKEMKVDIYRKPKTEELFTKAYFKLISDSDINSLQDGILIPPILIDEFIQDYDHIISFSNYWNVLNLPEKQSGILFKVINEVEKLADNAKIEFEYETAIDFYHRIYLTTLNCENSENIKVDSLLKQAEIHYHLDSYNEAKQLLTGTVTLSEKSKLPLRTGKALYYLGMINYIMAETEKADNFFKKALLNFENSDNDQKSIEYIQCKINKSLNLREYNNALLNINGFINKARKEDDKSLLSRCHDFYGTVYYSLQDYQRSEESYLEEYRISKESKNYEGLLRAIMNLLNLYVSQRLKDFDHVESLINELKEVSIKTRKKNCLTEANYKIGLYYYSNNDYINAEKYLRNSLAGYKLVKRKYPFLSNLFYLGRTYIYLKESNKAARTIKRLIRIANESNNYYYLSYGHNLLGMMYFELNKYKSALYHFNKATTNALELDHYFILGVCYKHIGIIHSKNKNTIRFTRSDYERSKKYFFEYSRLNTGYDISSELSYLDQELMSIPFTE